jgi:tRNA (guanine37-N1)-methyltransferase
LRFDFVTIFPGMFAPLLAEGVIARGIKAGLLDVRVWDLRDYATDKHRSTDDEAYGGGPGMVMLAEPVLRAVEAIITTPKTVVAGAPPAHPAEAAGTTEALRSLPHVVMTSPQGRVFDQSLAKELLAREHVVFLCGRYEGFDERVREALHPEEISIGDFVVSGGELPAMLMADAVGRLVEGVVGNSGSVEEDSFYRGLLDHPHYTRPLELRGMKVPEVLMSGHHEKIRKWRKEMALRATLAKRPDLLEGAELEGAELDEEAREMIRRIQNSE